MYPYLYHELIDHEEKKDQLFIAISYTPEFDDVIQKMIVPASESNNLEPYEVRNGIDNEPITQEILDNLIQSKFVLLDISKQVTGNRNENVFYELGLAHAWRLPQELIVISQDTSKLPFDIQDYRVWKYDRTRLADEATRLENLINRKFEEIKYIKRKIINQIKRRIDNICIIIANETRGSHFNSAKYDEQDSVKERMALWRMLELNLMYLDTDKNGKLYAYHWTSLGVQVMESIGIDMSHHESKRKSEHSPTDNNLRSPNDKKFEEMLESGSTASGATNPILAPSSSPITGTSSSILSLSHNYPDSLLDDGEDEKKN